MYLSLLCYIVLSNVLLALTFCRSDCAHTASSAGGSWGSPLSQPAQPDQTMSHKALLFMAAEWLVHMCCRGMTKYLPPYDVLTKDAHKTHDFDCATFLKGTRWSKGYMSGSSFAHVLGYATGFCANDYTLFQRRTCDSISPSNAAQCQKKAGKKMVDQNLMIKKISSVKYLKFGYNRFSRHQRCTQCILNIISVRLCESVVKPTEMYFKLLRRY